MGILFCGKITDPFQCLGLSYNFLKLVTGKLSVIGENDAGDAIRQISENLFRVKIISEGEIILKEVTGKQLQLIATETANIGGYKILINGSNKVVRLISNTTPINQRLCLSICAMDN